MGRLPTVADMGARRAPRASRAIGVVSGAGAVGAALGQLGQATSQIGEVIHEREATASAMERDTLVADQLRDLMYNPENGFMALNGQAAVGAQANLMEALDGLKAGAMEGLNATARRKLEGKIDARVARAKQASDIHTLGQRDAWLTGATVANIKSSRNDAIANIGETNLALASIEEQTRALGAQKGWGAAQTNLAVKEARSDVYVAQIERIAITDPAYAMEYLRQHEGSMQNADIAAVQQKLQPKVDQAEGRAMGAAAALNGVSDDYLSKIRGAESGGDDAAKNPLSTATGRYQFTKGTWSDVMRAHPELSLTVDGRTNGAQQERAIRAFTSDNAANLSRAGITPTAGNMYAAHFLGAGGARTVLLADNDASLDDLLPSGVIAANGFLAGKDVKWFKAWAAGKAGGDAVAFSGDNSDALAKISAEPNPVKRRAALQEYNLITAAQSKRKTDAEKKASTSLFQWIEGGGRITDMPVDVSQTLAGPVMSAARAYERSVAAGEVIQTNSQTYVDLTSATVSDPDGFMSEDPMLWRNNLDNKDFEHFVNMQAKMQSGSQDTSYKGPSPATLLNEADAQLRASGIQKTDNPAEYAQFQSQLIRWAEGNPVDADNPLRRNEQINRMLTPVVSDAGFWSAEKTRPLYAIDFDGSTPSTDDDMTQADINDAISGGGLDVGGRRVTQSDASSVYLELLAILNGTTTANVDLDDATLRQPTAKQLIEGLGELYR